MDNRCPRCGGQVLRDYSDIFCMQCGWRPDSVDGAMATIFTDRNQYGAIGPRIKDTKEHGYSYERG